MDRPDRWSFLCCPAFHTLMILEGPAATLQRLYMAERTCGAIKQVLIELVWTEQFPQGIKTLDREASRCGFWCFLVLLIITCFYSADTVVHCKGFTFLVFGQRFYLFWHYCWKLQSVEYDGISSHPWLQARLNAFSFNVQYFCSFRSFF